MWHKTYGLQISLRGCTNNNIDPKNVTDVTQNIWPMRLNIISMKEYAPILYFLELLPVNLWLSLTHHHHWTHQIYVLDMEPTKSWLCLCYTPMEIRVDCGIYQKWDTLEAKVHLEMAHTHWLQKGHIKHNLGFQMRSQ
mgnify:CR=1 FL=1